MDTLYTSAVFLLMDVSAVSYQHSWPGDSRSLQSCLVLPLGNTALNMFFYIISVILQVFLLLAYPAIVLFFQLILFKCQMDAFTREWLSMVSGNGVNSLPRPNYRTYRKMADVGIQYEPQDIALENLGEPTLNSTVAQTNTTVEINTAPEMNGCATTGELESSACVASQPPTLHRPHSVQSSTSTNSSSSEPRRRRSEEIDVDAICVHQCEIDEPDLSSINKKSSDKTEPDGFIIPEKEESNCGLDCMYFTMKCCECTIM